MLSGETSVGKFAIDAVKMMSKIAISTENSNFYKFDTDYEINDDIALTRQAIVFGVDKMLKYVNAKAILSFSHFGYSTRLMSKLKPSAPVKWLLPGVFIPSAKNGMLPWIRIYC